MLEVTDLHVSYGQSEVIHGLSLRAEPKKILAVMGRNGTGKTTLFRALIGLLPTRAGSIKVGGVELSQKESFERVNQGVGYVPQGRMIFSTLTVLENIETGLSRTRARRAHRKVPKKIFDLFPVLWDMRKRRGGNLSGGQQQQLAIARALASEPKVLLLDEPTEGIQPSIIKEIARALRRINEENEIAIVVSEQLMAFALEVAEAVMVLDRGEVVYESPRAAVSSETLARHLSI
jgi:urea transport system ATP-binding protein